jgi:hypothetical protein
MLSIRIVAGRALLLPTSLLAQGWTEYIDRADRFVSISSQPTIRDTTYPPQRAPLGHRFTVRSPRDVRRW